MGIITFGEKEEGKEYRHRPAVYCLMFNTPKNKLAIIQTSDGKYFLPGGGIENTETHKECLKREALEEMGMDVEIGPYVGCAQRYFYSTNEHQYYLSEGHFYLSNMGKKISKPIDDDHKLIWMEPLQAKENLYHEHQSWAIIEALKVRRMTNE